MKKLIKIRASVHDVESGMDEMFIERAVGYSKVSDIQLNKLINLSFDLARKMFLKENAKLIRVLDD